jgi:pyridoxal phosphate enzyme (YggS family)
MTIKDNLKKIRERIAVATLKSYKKPKDILLVAVTKKATIEQMNDALANGITAIGENRTEIAAEKFPHLIYIPNDDLGHYPIKIEKHMIGHLQTNKVKAAVTLFDVIQSIDSLRLAKEINKRAIDAGKVMDIMIEINISGEDQKFGIFPDEIDSFYNELLKLTNIKVIGMMAIAPFVPTEETRPYFKRMKHIFNRFNLKWLSMGMTDDYEIAIEEGANMIRIGTGIFGEKK